MSSLLKHFDETAKVRAKEQAKVRAAWIAKIHAQWAEDKRKTKEAWDALDKIIEDTRARNVAIWSYRARLMTVPAVHTREEWRIANEYNVAEGKKIVEELHNDPSNPFRLDILNDLGLPLP